MARYKDITNQKFGRWTALHWAGNGKWISECECGTEREVYGFMLRSGKSKSCGCLNLEMLKSRTKETMPHLGSNFKTHGESHTHFYSKWDGMIKRCRYDKGYVGRVTYSKEWEDFNTFKQDMYPSYLEHVEKYGEADTTLDRVENSGNYSKKNCQWLTRADNFSKNDKPNRRKV